MPLRSAGISPEGFKIIIITALLGWLCAYLDYTNLSLIFIFITLFNIFFFRDPERKPQSGKGIVLSPADGKVVEIKEEEEPDFLNHDMVRVSIFLSIFDCHINRFPVSGKVLSTSYKKGSFGLAYKPEASSENERLATLIESSQHIKIVMVQIAGLVARRIVSCADVDTSFTAGERFGMIKYGSRVDLYLPSGTEIEIKQGDKVRAGETRIACLAKEKE